MAERKARDARAAAGHTPSIRAEVVLRPEAPPYSADTLQRLGIRGLHCGSGANLHAGWLNTDILEMTGKNGVRSAPGRIAACGEAYYLQHDAAKAFPLGDFSLPRVFAEHFLEHLPLPVGVAWLAEMRRLLAPGGVLRISTPDLEKYVRGYLRAGDGRTAENAETAEGEREDTAKSAKRDGRFFDEHRRRTTVAKHRGKPPGVVVVHIPPA